MKIILFWWKKITKIFKNCPSEQMSQEVENTLKFVHIHTLLNNDFHLLNGLFHNISTSWIFPFFCEIFRGSGEWLSIQFLGPFQHFRAAAIHPVFGALSFFHSSGYPSSFWHHFILLEQQLSIQFLAPFHHFRAAAIHPVFGTILLF